MTGTHQLSKPDDALLRSLISTSLKEILSNRNPDWVIGNTLDILKQMANTYDVAVEIDVTWYE